MGWLVSFAIMVAFLVPSVSGAQARGAIHERSMNELTVEAEIGRPGDFMAWGFDALWMMSKPTLDKINGEWTTRDPALVRVDGRTNAVTDLEIPGTTGRVRGLAIGENAVWIPDTVSERIFKVDPISNKVALAIPVAFSGTEGSIGIGEGSVWITAKGDVLTRLDAASGAMQATVPLPGGAPAAIVNNGMVWVTGYARDELYKVDPKTNTIILTIPLHPSPRFLTAAEGSVWVLNQGDATVQRIDPASGKVEATIEMGTEHRGEGGDITAGGGYVWVTLRDVPLVQIDPRSNSLVAIFRGRGWGDAIRFGGGSLWISGRSIRRLKPPI
jgi:virginiamycin B lyase